MHPIMNDARWDELRVAMYGLGRLSPRWRAKDVSGHVSDWDGEWFYHFREGGYASIEWVEILAASPEQDAAVETALRRIHVPGHRIVEGFRVLGYVQEGTAVDFI
jgi:hypothetical protein